MSSPAAVTANNVTSVYRTLGRLIRQLPDQQIPGARKQLRDDFRKHANADAERIPSLIEVAEKKIAFLRIVTPKDRNRDGAQKGTANYVYRSETPGEYDENGRPRIETKARVSNWDGKNMDPCSVKHHFGNLRRAGFRNNEHAKGIF